MEDNGLLKYYKDKHYSKKGFLDLKKIEGYKPITSFDVSPGVAKVKMDENLYFIKKESSKGEIDAEVLLGQVYNKAGLTNAIYTPVLERDPIYGNRTRMMISNSIADIKKDIIARDLFCEDIIYHNEEPFLTTLKEELGYDSLYPSKKPNGELLIEKYFKIKAQRDIPLMQALDIASFNTDRNINGFFFNVSDGFITNVSTIDNEASCEFLDFYGKNIKDMLKSEFYCYVGEEELDSAKSILQELKTNETVNSIISSSEIAEKIGSVNIPETARDIKNEIGYKVDKDYVEILDRSFDYVAEELSK